MKNIIEKVKNFFRENKKSYILYTFASILFLLYATLILVFKNSIFIYILLFSLFLFIIGFFIDTYFLLKKYWKYVLIIFPIITVFYIYPDSQIFAKRLIYSITKENPDFFQNSVSLFANIFALISWMKFIFFILPFIYFGLSIILYVLIFLDLFIPKSLKEKIKLKMAHFIFYMLGFAFSIGFLSLASEYVLKILNENLNKYAKGIILKFSYYPNIVCENIDKGKYIKLIGSNYVSVSNISIRSNISIFNQKIKFEHKKCKRLSYEN